MCLVGEGSIFFFYPSKLLSGTPKTKDRSTREELTNVFNISFTWHQSLQKEGKTRRNCYIWRVEGRGKIWLDKGYEPSALNWGRLSKTCSFRFLCLSLYLPRGRRSLPMTVGRALLTWGFCDLFQGKVRKCFLYMSFLNFCLQYSICQGAVIWSTVLNLIIVYVSVSFWFFLNIQICILIIHCPFPSLHPNPSFFFFF